MCVFHNSLDLPPSTGAQEDITLVAAVQGDTAALVQDEQLALLTLPHLELPPVQLPRQPPLNHAHLSGDDELVPVRSCTALSLPVIRARQWIGVGGTYPTPCTTPYACTVLIHTHSDIIYQLYLGLCCTSGS